MEGLYGDAVIFVGIGKLLLETSGEYFEFGLGGGAPPPGLEDAGHHESAIVTFSPLFMPMMTFGSLP